MSASQGVFEGRCHCGNLSFLLRCAEPPQACAARSCDCSFCRACAARWIAPPGAALDLKVREPALESRYAFGTHTATFHVCARCGVVPVVTSQIEGALYALVNLNSLRGALPALAQTSALELGDETPEARLLRRKRNWIAQVSVERAGSAAADLQAAPFRTTRSILFGDCDPGGIVYTPRIAHFAVEAAMEFASQRLGKSAARHALETGVWPPARALSIEFLSPLTYDERVELAVQVEQIREHSTTLLITCYKANQVLAFRARLTQVFVSAKTFQRVAVPAELRE